MSSMVVYQPNSSVPSSSFTPLPPHPPCRYEYDVFLSFRGEDTRDNFVSHLHKELYLKGIRTYMDDKKLQTGKEIGPELLKAIEQSRFSIVVLSTNYASSRWCLNELVKILECNATATTTVYPVFYHVDPSEVRNQTGDFGKGLEVLLSKYDTTDIDQVQMWRDALKKVANLKGWPYPSETIRFETKFIEELVRGIFCKLDRPYPRGTDCLVGMLSRVEKVVELLGLGSDEARIVGIWGMGGIGKTTIARAVRDHISWKFEGCSFLENVRENSKKDRGVETLQEKLISDILMEVDFKVRDIDHKITMIGRKRVLIIFDDVDSSTNLEDIFGELCGFQFHPKSRIIITTRDQRTLIKYEVRHTYKVDELGKAEAVELFMSKAFGKQHQPTKDFEVVLDRAVEHAKGLPLALKVLGSSLKGRSKDIWESALDRLRKNKLRESDDDKVEKVLKISYDALARKDKKIFLDIACFFKGKDKDWVVKILYSCGFDSEIGINNLVEKSLVTISKRNELSMHDLIQQLGQNIVHDECPNEPGECSRLWLDDDIKNVLMHSTGTKKVEVISLEHSSIGQLELSPKAFKKMINLRIFKIRGGNISKDLNYLSNKLRLLDWSECPLKCMPSRFQPEHLVELHITGSPIKQLWNGAAYARNLKVMNLRDCNYLTKSPNFNEVPNLEELILLGCTSLVNLCASLGDLSRLILLEVGHCKNLESFPIGSRLESLEVLCVHFCPKLKTILGSFEQLKHLQRIYVIGVGIEDPPQSVENLTNLWQMNMRFCKNLTSIPNDIGRLTNVEYLYLGYGNLKLIPSDICSLHRLKELELSGNDFESLPSEMNQLSELYELRLCDCKKLQEIPELSSNVNSIEAGGCESLKKIWYPFINPKMKTSNFENCLKLVENGQSNILLKEFLANENVSVVFNSLYTFPRSLYKSLYGPKKKIKIPGSEISKLINYVMPSVSLSFKLPDRRIFGITFWFVVELKHQQYTRNQKFLLYLEFKDEKYGNPRFIQLWILRTDTSKFGRDGPTVNKDWTVVKPLSPSTPSITKFTQSVGFGIEMTASLSVIGRKNKRVVDGWHLNPLHAFFQPQEIRKTQRMEKKKNAEDGGIEAVPEKKGEDGGGHDTSHWEDKGEGEKNQIHWEDGGEGRHQDRKRRRRQKRRRRRSETRLRPEKKKRQEPTGDESEASVVSSVPVSQATGLSLSSSISGHCHRPLRLRSQSTATGSQSTGLSVPDLSPLASPSQETDY